MRNMYLVYFFLSLRGVPKKSAFISLTDTKALLCLRSFKRNEHDSIGIGNQF